MFISKIEVQSFRIFDDVGICAHFKKGVNAIIGENNCGKTALIDAIRIAFLTVPYKKDIFFNLSDFHVDNSGKRSNEAFISVYFGEVPADLFEIWNPEDTTKGEFHIQYYTVLSQNGKEKVRYNIWGGPVEGNPVTSDTFESIQLVFLGALRDAETEMRPARSSKLASLLTSVVSTDVEKDSLTAILKNANSKILKQNSIERVSKIINDNLATIEQDVLKQRIGIGLVEPRFESIAASLRAWLKPKWFYIEKKNEHFQEFKNSLTPDEWKKYASEDDNGAFIDVWALKDLSKNVPPEAEKLLSDLMGNSFDLYQNGLGYNNILFMSAVLGDMTSSGDDTLFNLLLVEEPEAHLHPQLQELVHCFFEKNAKQDNFQVIYTSHSPTLVSRIGIDKIVLLYENSHRINCLSLSESKLDDADRASLERYLDVTKSQMLFAKGIIFVEGISESLLLPIMAECMDRSFDQYAIEIVNIDGVSFKPFADLLCYANDIQMQTIRSAIVTDDDRCTDRQDEENYISKDLDYDTDKLTDVVKRLRSTKGSARYETIYTMCEQAHINIFGARKTLEYELAYNKNNIPYLLDAIEKSQPEAGGKLRVRVERLETLEEKAACVWLYIRYRSKYKGEFAQNLAYRLKREHEILQHSKIGDVPIKNPFVIPDYIKRAVFSVTKGE